MKILNPVAAPDKNRGMALPLLSDLKGLKVAILTNHWKSMDSMAQRMSLELKKRFSVSEVRIYDIPINGAMTEETERAVISECDAAIVGLAN